jgi:hypothetical protein
MGLYIYFLVFFIAFIYFVSTWRKTQASSLKLLAAMMAYMAIFIGIGDMIGGYDRYIYGEMFDVIADEMRRDGNLARIYYFVNGQEWGYFGWEVFISLFTKNRYIFILITTLVMYVLYFMAFKKYIDQYPMAVLVFLGFFFFFSITYMRQALAVGVIWNGLHYIWERKLVKFLIVIALAVSLHNSALVFLPSYFIANRYYTYNKVMVFLFVCLIIGLTPIPSILLSATGEAMEMTSRTTRYATDEMMGVRWEYILQVIVLLFLIYQNRSFLKRDNITNVFLNLSYLYFGILLIFIQFGQGGRFGWYFIMAVIYLFTNICTSKRNNIDARIIIISLCFILFYRIALNWSFNLTPYETFLTPGYPSGASYIYETWEYDDAYIHDKFYR